MNTPKNMLLAIAAMILFICPCVAGQEQRMAMASGNYSLQPHGTKTVDAFCLDKTRHAPTSDSTYSHVLSSQDSATVLIGKRRLSLADAIAEKIVAVRGQTLTEARANEIFNNEVKDKRLSPEDREFLRLLTLLSVGRGDFSQLSLVNMTSQPITIQTSNGLVVGTTAEPLPDIDVRAIMSSGSNGIDLQRRVWNAATRNHQLLLKDAGYYSGRLTGEADEEATRNAISRFKRSRQLGSEPIIDKETEVALKSAAREARDSKFLAMHLESTPNASTLYRLSFNGNALYVGDEIGELMKTIDKERNQRGRGNNIYLILKGFPDEKVDGLQSSFKAHQAINPELSIRPFQSEVDSTLAEDFFFSGGKTFVEESVTDPIFVVSGKNAGYYGSSFAVRDAKNETGTVSVFATLKPVVSAFVDGARTMFQKRQDWSPAKIANVARSRLRKQFNVSEEAIRLEFRDQFGRTHIAEITVSTVRWQTAD